MKPKFISRPRLGVRKIPTKMEVAGEFTKMVVGVIIFLGCCFAVSFGIATAVIHFKTR